MGIELPEDTRKEAGHRLHRALLRENVDEPVGSIAAGGLLGRFLE